MSDPLKAGIVTAIKADAGLGALIGDKIYADKAPQNVTLPYITYQIVTEEGVHHQTGITSLASTDIQFSVWAATASSRFDIKDALRVLFDGKIHQTFGSAFCQRVINTNNNDTIESQEDGSQNFSYGVFMDFEFWHNR